MEGGILHRVVRKGLYDKNIVREQVIWISDGRMCKDPGAGEGLDHPGTEKEPVWLKLSK